MAFSTYDRDNDNYNAGSCAAIHHGGWWYNACDRAYLNGRWASKDAQGVKWFASLKSGNTYLLYPNYSEMKVRMDT